MATLMALPNSKYSDMTIMCERQSWEVHAMIVCPKSNALEEVWENGETVRTAPRIQLSYKLLSTFFYGGNYQESATDEKAKPPIRSVVFHARVYDAAESLEAPDLETLAADKFERACECIWSGVEFVELAQAIYHGSTLHGRSFFDDDSELHGRFLKAAKARAAELLCSKPVCAAFKHAISLNADLHDLCVELAEALADR
ncbi:hypothetical protein CBER1_10812 [Cercospora berteroae]|uniref:BTB domain-containing protein n=1 Tax=Cercospora berteroae TaxID=357750 RepID=A0A2S6CM62_9PEZI|nr:hypothetical protein CBER1_10812 [Cercospora berteroae]